MRIRRLLTALALALVSVVVVASAVIRHSQAGFGCTPWPQCYGTPAAMTMAAQSSEVRIARASHRFAASAVTVLMLVLLLTAWRRRHELRAYVRFVQAALAIALALAALGALTAGSRSPVVTLANLVGGFALLATLTAALCVVTAELRSDRPTCIVATTALTLAFIQALLGGIIGARFAATACVHGCEPWAWADLTNQDLWNALHPPMPAGGGVGALTGASILHALHRTVGSVVALLLLLTWALARERWRTVTGALLAIAVVEPVLGILTAGPYAGLTLVLAHHVFAGVIVATLAGIAVTSQSSTAPIDAWSRISA